MRKNPLLLFILLANLLLANNTVAQTYVVGGDYDYAPITFIDKSGAANGLDIDILKTISKKRNIRFSYQLSEWDSALHYIQTGEIDIITGIIFSTEREAFVDFTIPIHTEYYSIFIRDDLKFKDISSLYAYEPIVLEKDISIEKYLVPMGLYENYTVAKSLPEALREIEMGNADYVVAPNSLGNNEIKRNSYQNIEVKGPPVIPSIYCMAVRKGNTQLLNILNEEIIDLRQSGQLFAIQNKWEVHELEGFQYRRILKIIGIFLGVALFLLLLFLIWNWTLRSQVRKNMVSIHQKNLELQKSEFQLKELNTTKDRLFSIIAHDLRAPFNSIIGFSELLAKEAEVKQLEKIGKYSGMITTASQKAMDLLSNLMEWSSSQTGRMKFSPRDIDLQKVVNENINFYTEIAKQKSVTVANSIDAPVTVHADEAMVNTILRNLISNAIKFTAGGGQIRIDAKGRKHHVEISVSDNGTGMPNTMADTLFDPEGPDSTPGTQNECGTGLGLMLCKEFIDKHNGKLWVESEIGKGSVFYFTLPLPKLSTP